MMAVLFFVYEDLSSFFEQAQPGFLQLISSWSVSGGEAIETVLISEKLRGAEA